MTDLTLLSIVIHAENVKAGWWDAWPVKTDRHETAMMLIVSEFAEAMEGHRKGLNDDHLPEFKAFDVELADAMIRLLDLAGAYEMSLADGWKPVDRLAHNWSLKSPPEQLWQAVRSLYTFVCEDAVYQGIVSVLVIAQLHEIDLFKLIDLKRAYNQKRADHKREARESARGKAY